MNHTNTPAPIGAPDTLTDTAPERIWLQIDPHGRPIDRDEPFPDDGDVTWCRDSVGGVEVEYVRADLGSAAQPVAVPPGYVLVPVEPTVKMLAAGDEKTWVLPARDCWRAMLAAAPKAAPVHPILAKKHASSKVDYRGLLGQCRGVLRRHGDSGYAEMLRQLEGHMTELGQRWYAGDPAVVDELLQLYCVEREAREALAARPATPAAQGDALDSERLDWLASQTRNSNTGISFDWCRHAEDGRVLERGYRFMSRAFLGARCEDFRAAIDAARAAKEGGAA